MECDRGREVFLGTVSWDLTNEIGRGLEENEEGPRT